MTDSFLSSVARAYTSRYDDLSEFKFVFPGKRAAAFFRKYLREGLERDQVMLEPELLTISDFAGDLSGLVIDSRIDLLLQLYVVYRNMQPGRELDFEKFRSWGETAIADFNDVEMYGVNPEALFKNLSDLKEINSTFLSEEQITVIKDYFGDVPYDNAVESFWTHFQGNGSIKPDSPRRSFLKIWEVMGSLMERFNSALEARGVAYPGMAFRKALENIRSNGAEALKAKRVIFVGFNVLSTVEWSIFRAIGKISVEENGKSISMADYYWDCTGPAMADDSNSAVHFMRANVRHFPSRFDISESNSEELPAVLRVISAPSNSAQAKITGSILADLKSRLPEREFAAAKVAVVLPDEGLLLPLMHSLPGDIGNVNLTMGYSMRLTSVMSLLDVVRRLRRRSRFDGDILSYYYEDVRTFLSHPYVRLVAGTVATREAVKQVNESRRYMIARDFLLSLVPGLNEFLPAHASVRTGRELLLNLDCILTCCADAVEASDESGLVKTRLDLAMLNAAREALLRVESSLVEFGVNTDAETTFSLAHRLIGSGKVNFEGEPLEGVQIMGPLETRCLDFDYVIIPSMNERIFPRKLHSRSFIPANLRHGYGMATTRFQESIFAYNFYRLISRAKEVYMIYDARSNGLKSGDVSRYLLQLRHLYAPERIEWETRNFSVESSEPEPIVVAKGEETLEKLKEFTIRGSKSNFSSSSLVKYISCPLRFYLEHVRGLRVENDPEEFMNAATQGQIIHEVMQRVYSRGSIEKPFEVTSGFLDKVLANPDVLDRIITQRVNHHYNHLAEQDLNRPLQNEAELFGKVIGRIVRRVLEFDRTLTPFEYLGSEIKKVCSVDYGGSQPVNFKFVIDRLDRVNGKLRVVDYKTGSVNLKLDDIADLFIGNNGYKYAFQLLLYSVLLEQEFDLDEAISPVIYNMVRMSAKRWETSRDKRPDASITVGNESVSDHRDLENDFTEGLKNMLADIMNPDKPFMQTDDPEHCTYCPFVQLCGR